MPLLWFYCDESLDSPQHLPKNYCVAGLLGEEHTFAKLERGWQRVNDRLGVKRYHASPLNARDGEYEGWSTERSIDYSKRLLKILKMRGGKLQVTSIGIHADEYRAILSSEAQQRLGHPYIACFKGCVMMIASYMRNLPKDWKLSVIFERNEQLQEDIIKAFNKIKNLDSELGGRLETCTAGQWDKNVALQPADLVAYESMRLIQNKRTGRQQMRHAFKELTGISGFMGYYYDREMLEDLKPSLEASKCLPGCWFPLSRQWDPDYRDGDTWEDVERKQARA